MHEYLDGGVYISCYGDVKGEVTCWDVSSTCTDREAAAPGLLTGVDPRAISQTEFIIIRHLSSHPRSLIPAEKPSFTSTTAAGTPGK